MKKEMTVNNKNSRVGIRNIVLILVLIILSLPFISIDLYLFFNANYSYMLLFLTIILFFTNKKFLIGNKTIFYSTVFLIVISFILIKSHKGIGYLVPFIWIFILATTYRNIKFDYYTNKILSAICIVIFIIIFIRCFSTDFSNFESNPKYIEFNPNTLGLMMGAISLLYESISYEKKNKKANFLIKLITMIAIFKSASRASLLAYLTCFIFELFINSRLNKINISKYVLLCIGIAIVVPMIYCYLFNGNYFINTTIAGKSFYTGREYIWINLYENMMQSFPKSLLFGFNLNLDLFENSNNFHNSYYSIVAILGLIVLILFIVILVRIINKYSLDTIDKKHNIQMKYFLIVIFYLIASTFETTLLFLPVIYPFGIALGMYIRFGMEGRYE